MTRPRYGTNNDVVILKGGGRTYVLRRYQNLDAGQARRETALLAQLGAADLPYAVPAPIPTRAGELLLEDGDGAPTAVHELIPGRPPTRALPELAIVATAYGVLSTALAALPQELAPHDWRGVPLERVHPLAGDPTCLADEFAPHDDQVRWWWRHAVQRENARLAAAQDLPCQIVHGDVALSNTLVSQDGLEATGILDFELSGLDARAADLATGLATCCGTPWAPGIEEQVATFTEAYLAQVPLTDVELAAVPDLVSARVVGSVAWRAGRARAGHAEPSQVSRLMQDGMRRGDFPSAYRLI